MRGNAKCREAEPLRPKHQRRSLFSAIQAGSSLMTPCPCQSLTPYNPIVWTQNFSGHTDHMSVQHMIYVPKQKLPLSSSGNSCLCGHYHFHLTEAGTMFTGAAVDVQRTSHSTEGSIMKREKHHACRAKTLYFSNIVFMFLKNNEVNSWISVVVIVSQCCNSTEAPTICSDLELG